jgi:hypothetical protein
MACSTLTTLNRGSRSMWMSKTKPAGQVVTARRSATVFAVTGIPCSTSTLMSSRYPRRSLCHILDCVGLVSRHISSPNASLPEPVHILAGSLFLELYSHRPETLNAGRRRGSQHIMAPKRRSRPAMKSAASKAATANNARPRKPKLPKEKLRLSNLEEALQTIGEIWRDIQPRRR